MSKIPRQHLTSNGGISTYSVDCSIASSITSKSSKKREGREPRPVTPDAFPALQQILREKEERLAKREQREGRRKDG
jgi:hypothetical protein